jgi:hypothetical protein
MKKTISAFAFLAAVSAFADGNPLLMVVESHSGHVPQGMQYSVECKIYEDVTYIETTKGRGKTETNVVETKYTPKVKNAKIALKMFEGMANRENDETDGPMDGPTVSYVGVMEGDVVERRVKIYSKGSTIVRNRGEAYVAATVEFADFNCNTEE